tara:strand:- start:70 stop:309 length:240 start_codon:yes stop_codon:yes gene_type:complete
LEHNGDNFYYILSTLDYRNIRVITESFSIEEILSAVEDLQKNKNKENFKKTESKNKIKNSEIPINTLKLIEEAEKNIKN